METLCILRYFGDRHEKARRDHQVHRRPTEEEKEDGRAAREKKEESWTPRVPGHFGPGGPARPVAPLPVGPGCPAMEGPGARTTPALPPATLGCLAACAQPPFGCRTLRPRVPGPLSPVLLPPARVPGPSPSGADPSPAGPGCPASTAQAPASTPGARA
nr:basic proline-rich protein-like [Aegilops tauschii subsp. strangulata]